MQRIVKYKFIHIKDFINGSDTEFENHDNEVVESKNANGNALSDDEDVNHEQDITRAEIGLDGTVKSHENGFNYDLMNR